MTKNVAPLVNAGFLAAFSKFPTYLSDLYSLPQLMNISIRYSVSTYDNFQTSLQKQSICQNTELAAEYVSMRVRDTVVMGE
jgi:hypothetical protein